ncbi:unnamed protein product [Closterium sp. Naga37s-1]|nr:unnamed protein product [Closterium sp. Naga37s-1]
MRTAAVSPVAAAVLLEPPPTSVSTVAAADSWEKRTRRQRKRRTGSNPDELALTGEDLLKRLSGQQGDGASNAYDTADAATPFMKVDPSATGLSLVAEVAAFLVRLDDAESASPPSSPSSQASKSSENDYDGDAARLEVTREVRAQLEAAWNLSPSDALRGARRKPVRGRRFLSASATKLPAGGVAEGETDAGGSMAEIDPAARRRAMRRRLRAAALAMGLRMSGNALGMAEDGQAEAELESETEAVSASPRVRGSGGAGRGSASGGAAGGNAMSEEEVDALIRDYGGGDTAMNVDWTQQRALLPAKEELRLAELIQRGNELEERAKTAATSARPARVDSLQGSGSVAATSAAREEVKAAHEVTQAYADVRGNGEDRYADGEGEAEAGGSIARAEQKQGQRHVLSHAEWAALCNLTPKQLHRQLLAAQAARTKLVLHNLRLVLSIAHSFRLSTGADFIAVCQRGLEGLTTAARRFDPARKLRFSTFATHAVRTAIIRAIPSTQFVRMPARSSMTLISVRKARAAVENRVGRKATVAEVAAEAGLSAAQCRAALAAPLVTRPVSLHAASRVTGLALEDTIASIDGGEGGLIASAPATTGAALAATAAGAGAATAGTASATAAVGGGSGGGVSAESGKGSSMSVQGGALGHTRAALVAVLDTLHPHEATVLRWRFGLGGKDGPGFAGEFAGGFVIVLRGSDEACGLLEQQVLARAQALQGSLQGGL